MRKRKPMRPPFKVWYVGLESYNSRYSFQLTEWNRIGFAKANVNYEVIESPWADQHSDTGIQVGQVLDAFRRPMHAMSQIHQLLRELSSGNIKPQDMIFFEDMFHPGIEALGYALDQMPKQKRPYIVVRCLAQTIDPDDFVHGRPEFANWMRSYEKMTLGIVDAVFAASEEMVTHMTIAGWKTPVYVTGLPFDKNNVLTSVGPIQPFKNRKLRVAFASRTDWEKQPEFFIKVAEEIRRNGTNPIEFAILSGKPLSSNSESTLEAIKSARRIGTLKVYDNLSKDAYYDLLADSRVLFNCALQDWVSNTVSEADALGTNVLFPAYRSFPELFHNDHTRLYIPWSIEDATMKLKRLLFEPHPFQGKIAENMSDTVGRTVEAMGHLLISTHAQKGITLKDEVYDEFMWCRNYRNPEVPSAYRPLITDAATGAWYTFGTAKHSLLGNVKDYWLAPMYDYEFNRNLIQQTTAHKSHTPTTTKQKD